MIHLMGLTFTFIGEFMIGYTAIAVHYRFWREHRIDQRVFTTMRRERIVGIFGLIFLVAGYLAQLFSEHYISFL